MAGTTNSHVKAILRQLDKPQLTKLAKQKTRRMTVHEMTKAELVEWLSHIITKREITEILSKPGRTGDKAVIDGMTFERKVMAHFRKQKFECDLNDVSIPHMEFDIVGYKKEKWNWGLDWAEYYMIAECKNKPKVTMSDLSKFYLKYQHFMKLKKETSEYCKGYLVTSGYFEPQVKKIAKQHGIQLVTKR